MSRPRAECWKADGEATLEVPIGEVQFNGWSPEPTIGEVCAATENGLSAWTRGMCARVPTATEADCAAFLSTVAAKLNFGLPDDINEIEQRELAVMLGGRPSSDSENDEAWSDAQWDTLTSLWLWTYEEHIPRDTLVDVLATHLSTRKPYVHSEYYDRINMDKITQALAERLKLLENDNVERLMARTPHFECAEPEVPPPEEGWSDGSDSSEECTDICGY